MRDDRERLNHILEAIGKIEKYARLGKREFLQNELIQNWILHHLQIIGEAANHLSDLTYQNNPDILWKSIVQLRNILVHQYFEIDVELIWSIVEKDIPSLNDSIMLILKKDMS